MPRLRTEAYLNFAVAILFAIALFSTLATRARADGDAIVIGSKGEVGAGKTSSEAETEGERKPEPEQGKYTRRGFVRMFVPNGRITGNTTDKLYHIEGGIEIYYYNTMMKGDTADIDQNTETAVMKGNVFVEDTEYRITCDEISVAYKDNWLKATGFVQFERYNLGIADVKGGEQKKTKLLTVFKNKQTKVYCSTLEYNWDTEYLNATGEVKVVQDDSVIEASEMHYDSLAGEYVLSGNVVLTIEKYGWLFDSGVVEKEDEDVAQALTKKKSTLTCDEMRLNEESGGFTCTMNEDSEGQVVIDQGDKKLTCDKFDANDSTKLIKASGKVEYKQAEGNWLIDSGLVKENEAEGEVVEELKHPMTITTDTMSFDYDKRKLTAEGETVRIEGREGKNAECSSLTFDDREKVLEMSGGVVISSGKEYMYCDSLRADTDNKVYEFFGDVDGFFKYQKRDEPDKPKEESAGATGSGGTGTGVGAGGSGEGSGEGDGGGAPIIPPRIEEEG